MVLEGVAADPSRPVSAYPLLSADEREKLLVDWNQTALDYPRESCLPQVFEAQVFSESSRSVTMPPANGELGNMAMKRGARSTATL